MVRVLVQPGAARRWRLTSERANYPTDPAMLWGDQHAAYSPAPAGSCSITRRGEPITTTINGVKRTINSGQDKTLLRFLREDVGLPGTKEGCAEGECGACTVFLDGAAVMACMVAGAARARRGDRHGRGAARATATERTAAPDPGGVCRRGRGAVWLLHAGLLDGGREAAGRTSAADSGADRAEHHRQPMPLHGLL